MFFEVSEVTKSYGGLVANDKVSLKIDKGEIVGLIGPNGAGKSTLFQMVQGFVVADSGSIKLKGTELVNKPTYKICREGIACTFQHALLFPKLTLGESVRMGAYCRTSSRKKATEHARRMIEFVGLTDKEDKQINKLNIYDRKCAELVAALATEPELLLLDELFAGLNSSEVSDMIALVKRINTELKVTLFIIEHVLKVIMSISRRVYVLDYGKLIASGTPQEISVSPLVIKAYLGEEYNELES